MQIFEFERIGEDGERFVPHRYRDGFFRVADPALGKNKHHKNNQLKIQEGEIEAYVIKKGFSLRMRGEAKGQINLIRREEIVVRNTETKQKT